MDASSRPGSREIRNQLIRCQKHGLSHVIWICCVVLTIASLLMAEETAADQKNPDDVDLPSPAAIESVPASLDADILPPDVERMTIDLGSALRLADLQNPRMALAREMIVESIAQHKEARALWLPTLAAGANYHY